MSILIKNGTVVDPGSKTALQADVLIRGNVIEKIGECGVNDADRVIDASGCYVMPGFIDLHVHLRDPGLEYKEDIRTGGAAALCGGFTTIVAMPNTKPAADCADVIRYVNDKSRAVTKVHVLQAGAVTKGQLGKELSDIHGMAEQGCICISEDGKSVMDSGLYRNGMKEAAKENMTVLAHCEDINMVNGGVMNSDAKSESMGLPGITNAVEDVIAARDILLAKETGVRLHLCHCSTKDSVEMVRMAKATGVKVTAEVCPHHFTLTSDDIPGDDANYKMNPPLRTRADVEALRQGLADDVMDVISTDHAPHAANEKSGGFKSSPFGIVGLETAAALTYTELVKPGVITLMQMAEKMCCNPARILGIEKGVLSEGAYADVTVFDPDEEWTVDPEKFASKGRNTPFAGRRLTGRVKYTISDGEVAYEDNNVI